MARYMIVETDNFQYKIVNTMTGVAMSFAPDRAPRPAVSDQDVTFIPRYVIACHIADSMNRVAS